MKTRKKHNLLKFCLAGVLVLAVASVFSYVYISDNLSAKGPAGETAMVKINQNDLLSDVTASLRAQGLIGEPLIFEPYAKIIRKTDFKVGVYKIDRGWDAQTILTYMTDATNAERTDVVLTIVPGDWAKDVAQSIADVTAYSADDILAMWNDKTYLTTLEADYSVLTPAINKTGVKVLLEGYLMPETYYIDPTASIDVITRKILDQTQSFYNANQAAFAASKYSVQQIFTLASIVQFEASKETDMKMVAQVFINRMNKPMRLQSNVTICYALYNYTDWTQCESDANKSYASPYNTYLHDGLPPGPIDNPSATAILATLNPTANDFYYFVADVYGDGTVYYSKTYQEHLARIALLKAKNGK